MRCTLLGRGSLWVEVAGYCLLIFREIDKYLIKSFFVVCEMQLHLSRKNYLWSVY